jgi:L-cysteine S-thiosulfotransferase
VAPKRLVSLQRSALAIRAVSQIAFAVCVLALITGVGTIAGQTSSPVKPPAASTLSASTAADPRRSGFDFMGPSTQAMQKDDALNPGMLWIKDGEALWNKPAGPSAKACASCHGDAKDSMRGVAARYPSFDDGLKRPIALSQRINQCRQNKQQAEALRPEGDELLALETYVAHQSRGLPVAPPDDPRLSPFRQQGEHRFRQQLGQLGLSCAQCHDDNAGKRLGGSIIPQGHANGYPLYRLEWQAMGSLQRRLRNCMTGVRAEPFAFGALELVELELYLAFRGRGLTVEVPAVRP